MEDGQTFPLYDRPPTAQGRPSAVNEYPHREHHRTPWIPEISGADPGRESLDGQYSIMDDVSVGNGQTGAFDACDACDVCGASLMDHKSAMQVLAELPLDTVTKLFRHQWHKDMSRIIFAHSEQYIRDKDWPSMRSGSPNWTLYRPRRWNLQHQQLKLLRRDLAWHRSKYISYYLDSVITSTRWLKSDSGTSSAQVTKRKANKIKRNLTHALRISVPHDLASVFYGEVPHAMEGVFDRAEIDDIITRPDSLGAQVHPLLFCVPITVTVISINQPGLEIIPKNPDHHWCWNQSAEYIKAKHEAVKLDIF
ncbi:hypothetical protein F5X99DRAFT_390794 [Biscogniauxia marginata]|nr:hypothetical protein F5X99DRAFT_390794 [Biscogniauxia marginata]